MTDNKKDIPKHWKIKKLEDACNILDNLRKPINTTERNKRIARKSKDDLYPYYGATGQVGWIDDFLTDGEFILVGEDGAPFLDIFKEKAYIIRGKSWVNNHAHILREVKNTTVNKFILYYLNSISYKDYVNGTTRLKLTKSNLKDIPFPIPPLSEQKAIVKKIEELFSELDKGIEDLRTAQNQLKIYRQSLLKWAFEGKLTNDNVKEGKLPKGWKYSSLASFIEKPKYGTSKKCDYVGQTGVLRIPNILKGEIDISDLKRADFTKEDKETYSLQQGDILVIRSNGSIDIVGKCAIIKGKEEKYLYAGYLIRLRCKSEVLNPRYLLHILSSPSLRIQIETKAKSTSGVNNINSEELKNLVISVPSTIDEQQRIVEILEEKFSVCDQMEQTMVQSLQQAESLRQSILKQAFEGKLVTTQEEVPAYTPKKIPFYQAQLFGYMIATSANNNIDHGEMTLAKNSYLIDKIYGVPTYFDYGRGHLGPYSIQMKNVLYGGNLKQFFKKGEFHIELQNSDKLFKYTNPYEARTKMVMEELSAIFSQYDDIERSYQTELLATVCKVIEDIQTTDLKAIRKSMKEWKIDLKTTKYKNKAEKFSESDTASCLSFILSRGWDKKLIN